MSHNDHYRLTVTRTPSANELRGHAYRGNHWFYKRCLQNYKQSLCEAKQVLKPPKLEGKRKVVVTRHSTRSLDFDNFVAGCKPLIDALVQSGWLEDDKPECLDAEYRQEKGAAQTVVEVWV